jgi:hypothetical protein
MDKLDMILKELAEIKSLLAVNKRAPSIPWQEKFMMWQDYRNGVKVKDIAKYYNVSVPSVYQWIKTMPGQREFDNLFGISHGMITVYSCILLGLWNHFRSM